LGCPIVPFVMSMFEQWLQCVSCTARYRELTDFAGCSVCARQGKLSPLELRYDYTTSGQIEPDCGMPGIWRWHALLPRVDAANRITLHEGNTPLIQLRDWSGAARLYFKNETTNPTWTWKDRANAISVSAARNSGFNNLVAVTTGNHGVSAAAYAAAARLHSVIFCHEMAPELQLALMGLHGARVFRGGHRDSLQRQLVALGDWFPATTLCPRSGCSNPFGIEGFKTIAFELFYQLGRNVPDRVFIPVGSGDGLYGIWKGFQELERVGAIDKAPRLFACQAAGVAPYVKAFLQGARRLTPVDPVSTIALSIAEPIGGDHALHAIYESGGAATSVTDDEILAARLALGRQGLALEPASAAAYAVARTLQSEGKSNERWVVVGTGTALKWPRTLLDGYHLPEVLSATVNCLGELPTRYLE